MTPFGDRHSGFAAVAIADDGTRVVFGKKEATVAWDVKKNEMLWEAPKRSKNVPALRFSPDTAKVLVASGADIVTLDATSGREEIVPPRSKFKAFTGKATAVVEVAGKVRGIDLQTGEVTDVALPPREGTPEALPDWADGYEFGADGNLIGWRSEDGLECKPFRVWTSSGDWTLRPPEPCGTESTGSPWIPLPGAIGFIGQADVAVFDASKRSLAYEIARHGRDVMALVTSPNLDAVLVVFQQTDTSTTTAGGMFTVELWERDSGEPVRVWARGQERMGAGPLSYAPDGSGFLIGWRDGTLELVTPDGDERTLATLRGPIESLRWSADGAFLASTDRGDETVIVAVEPPTR